MPRTAHLKESLLLALKCPLSLVDPPREEHPPVEPSKIGDTDFDGMLGLRNHYTVQQMTTTQPNQRGKYRRCDEK